MTYIWTSISCMARIHFNYSINPNKENGSVIKTSKTGASASKSSRPAEVKLKALVWFEEVSFVLFSILTENIKSRSMAYSISGPQHWSWMSQLHQTAITEGHYDLRTGLPHHGSNTPTEEWVIQPSQQHLLSLSAELANKSTGGSATSLMLHVYHETHSRGIRLTPPGWARQQMYGITSCCSGTPPVHFYFYGKARSSSVPYKPQPLLPEQKSNKNGKAPTGEQDSEKLDTALGFWALLCRRGNKTQIQ